MNVSPYSNRDLLVIGGTSSLGEAIIAQASEKKLTYLATCRDIGTQLRDPNHFYALDLSSMSSIDSFLDSIANFKFKKIIYCIGATSGIKLESIQISEIESYFKVNLINAFYLIGKICDYLGGASNSTFAAVSSRAANNPSFDFCYAASKGALASYVSSLARQLPADKKTVVFSPGALLNSNMFLQMPDQVRKSHLDRSGGKLLTVNEAAELILGVLESEIRSGSIIEIGPNYN